MLQPAMRSTSRLSSTNGMSRASASCWPRVDLPAPRRPTRAMRRPRAAGAAVAEHAGERQPGAAQLGVAACRAAARAASATPASWWSCRRPARRASSRARSATCCSTRIEALPMPYSRLARCRSETPEAAATDLRVRPRRARSRRTRSPRARRKGSLSLRGHTCSIVLDMDISPPEPLNFAQHLFQDQRRPRRQDRLRRRPRQA